MGSIGVVESLEYSCFLPGGYQRTERPVDEHYGIHPKIYLLTERGMTEQGRDKFFARMFSGKEEMERFKENRACRAIDEQRDELRLIREQSARKCPKCTGSGFMFPRGMLSSRWKIKRNWWGNRVEIITLPGDITRFTC